LVPLSNQMGYLAIATCPIFKSSESPSSANGRVSVESSLTTAKSVISSVPIILPPNILPSGKVIFSL
jgi:hypothetical protein